MRLNLNTMELLVSLSKSKRNFTKVYGFNLIHTLFSFSTKTDDF